MSQNSQSQDQRLERLEDVERIKEIKYLYARHLDDGFDGESIAGLFTEDGEWIIKGVGGEVRGRAGIKLHCENLKNGISWSQHNIFAPRIELNAEGDKAVARSNLVCLLTMNSDAKSSPGEAYIL
ncbi:nuclear transport factor 2 family protein, partial [Pseudomonas fluorescens]|uniref:nuclear transport factor 2 family protein n=1 Tax=Pseudomonas fluorescens TaxID=294 RepID=UPI0012422D25